MTEGPLRYAVIPTKGNRQDNLIKLLTQLVIERVQPIVIDTSNDGSVLDRLSSLAGLIVLRPESYETNISAWWNLGLREAELEAGIYKAELRAGVYGAEQAALYGWDVAVLNDDCLPPPGWFDAVSAAMRERDCLAGCSGGTDVTYRSWPIPLQSTMTGFAFVLRGEAGLRFDEDLVWWYGDNAMCWDAASKGGYTMISTHPVEHLYPNGQMTPKLHEQTARDRDVFITKFGMAPW